MKYALEDQSYYDGKYEYQVSKIVELTKDFKIEEEYVSVLWDKFPSNLKYVWEDNMNKTNIFLEHVSRILDADLDYPIIVFKNKNICDGCHRLIKAKILGLEKIKVKYITKKLIEHLRNDI